MKYILVNKTTILGDKMEYTILDDNGSAHNLIEYLQNGVEELMPNVSPSYIAHLALQAYQGCEGEFILIEQRYWNEAKLFYEHRSIGHRMEDSANVFQNDYSSMINDGLTLDNIHSSYGEYLFNVKNNLNDVLKLTALSRLFLEGVINNYGNIKDPSDVNHDYVLTFGKFRGMSIEAVLNTDPSYVIWLNENVKTINIPELIIDEATDIIGNNAIDNDDDFGEHF